jgi:hypothetical protein
MVIYLAVTGADRTEKVAADAHPDHPAHPEHPEHQEHQRRLRLGLAGQET